MNSTRRAILKTLPVTPFLVQGYISDATANPWDRPSPVNVLIPPDYLPPTDPDSQLRLKKATLAFIEENYQGVTLAFWNKTPGEVDLEKRLVNIIYWIAVAVETHRAVYPVDPAWVVAQIMTESFFYEFAVSEDLAAGICQFIPKTAKSYHMIYAGSLPEHHRPPFLSPEYAGKADEYYRLRREKNQFIKTERPDDLFTLEEALQLLADKTPDAVQVERSLRHLNYLYKLQEFDEKMALCRQQYRQYLQANLERNGHQRDLFADIDFFLHFDERFTYKKPILAMVEMMARGLKARNGNILAAAAAYNAGLRSTYFDEPVFQRYGKIPSVDETTIYLSRTVANYQEITKRLYTA